jgi:biopolymer transport protein ExbD
MKRRFNLKINHNSEFELDLAPLLAVMVKLVPVLLVSSAFVQMMIIETDLPQVVQEAIKKQDENPKSAQVAVEVNKTEGVKIVVTENGLEKIEVIGFDANKKIDYPTLHAKLVEIKKAHPEIFKIDFSPDSDIAYKDVVKIMDEARKVRAQGVRFPVKDAKTGQDTTTDYMFPEIVFSNMLDG